MNPAEMTDAQVEGATKAPEMGARIVVAIHAGVRAIDITAEARVVAIEMPTGDAPGTWAQAGVPEETSVRNAGMTVMLAALDAMFSTRSAEGVLDVAEAYVEEPTTVEAQTAQDLRERIDAVLAWLVVSTSGQITGEARDHLIDLLHGRA